MEQEDKIKNNYSTKDGLVKNRVLNFRPLFCLFVGFLLGGLIVRKFFGLEKNILYFLIVLIALTVIVLVVNFGFKTNINAIYKKIINWLVIGIAIGSVLCGILLTKRAEYPLQEGNYLIEGRVEACQSYEAYNVATLSKVKINNCNYNFKISLKIYSKETLGGELDVGMIISYDGTLAKNYLLSMGQINSAVAVKNIKYYSTIVNVKQILTGKLTLAEKIKQNVNNMLKQNLSEDYANLSYSMLFGDKSNLDGDIYAIFQECGVAHVLAVSGLHIALIVGIIVFLLKRLKIKQKYQFVIVALFLLMYCYICGYSASTVRASVMCLTYMLASTLGMRKDRLNTASFAGLILLLTSPTQMFSIGFQLSFACVFGIILLSKPIKNIVVKTYLPDFICNLITLSLCATIATAPFVGLYFGRLSVSSLLSNIIILPIFTISYYCLFLSSVIGLIFGKCILFTIVAFLYKIIISLGSFFSLLGMFKLNQLSTIAIVCFVAMVFVVSNFVNLNNFKKLVCLLIAVIICLGSTIISNVNVVYNESIIQSKVEHAFALSVNNSNYLLGIGTNGSEYELAEITKMLKYYKLNKIKSVVLINYTPNMKSNLIEILKEYKVHNVIFSSVIKKENIDDFLRETTIKVSVVDFGEKTLIDDNLEIKNSTLNYCYELYFCGKEFLVPTKNMSQQMVQALDQQSKVVISNNNSLTKSLTNIFKRDYISDIAFNVKNVLM